MVERVGAGQADFRGGAKIHPVTSRNPRRAAPGIDPKGKIMNRNHLMHLATLPASRGKPVTAQAPKPAPRRAADPLAAEDATGWRAARKAEARQVAGWLRATAPKKATKAKPAAERPTLAGLERALAAENARQAKPIGFAAVKGGVQ